MGIFNKLLGGGSGSRRMLQGTSRATAERIRNILGIRELETMPVQAARAFQLASDHNAKSDDFVAVIESDEVLSARVIRIANSVYFFRGTAANDIEKAVANIGLDELRCLLSAAMLKNLLTSRHPIRDAIWSNSVATAMLARSMARNCRHIEPGEAFLAGLLHDVGKLIMIRKGGQLYDSVIARIGSGELSVIEAEEEVFELNHVEVGKWVAEMWHFPQSTIEAIAWHHESLPKGTDPVPVTIDRLIKSADLIAHSLGIGHGTHLRSFAKRAEHERDDILPRLGFSKEICEGLIRDFSRKFEDELSLYQPEGH